MRSTAWAFYDVYLIYDFMIYYLIYDIIARKSENFFLLRKDSFKIKLSQ